MLYKVFPGGKFGQESGANKNKNWQKTKITKPYNNGQSRQARQYILAVVCGQIGPLDHFMSKNCL